MTAAKTNIHSLQHRRREANHKYENVKKSRHFALRLCVGTVPTAASGCFVLSYGKVNDIKTNCDVVRPTSGKTKVLRFSFGFTDFNWLEFCKVSLTDRRQPD